MKSYFAIFGSLSLLMISVPAFAQSSSSDEDYVYVNIGANLLSSDVDLNDIDAAGTPVSLGEQTIDSTMIFGRVGYRFLPYLAVEAEAGFGLGSDSFSQTFPVDTDFGTFDVDADIDAEVTNYFGGFVRGIFPLAENIDIFARGGYGAAKAKASAVASTAALPGFTASGSQSETAGSFAYGVGAEYRFEGGHGIRLDYAQITDTKLISVAYSFGF